MKRLTAVALSWLVVLGAFPADAQVVLGRAALTPGLSAPAPVPSGLAPAASLLAPSVTAPALAVSIAPTAFAPAPVLSAPAALLASPVPVAAAASPSRTPSPVSALKTAASIPEAAAPAFDGGRLAAASTPDPVEPGREARAPAKRSLLQRYKDSRKDSTPKLAAFAKGAFAASMAAVAVPPLLSMAPALKIGAAIAFTNLALFALIVPASLALWAARKLRRSPEAARPPPRAAGSRRPWPWACSSEPASA
ncbi:MAG: hypothetical protein M0D55_17670 [Elusimicrobiota bacterium]|nr:MAG: hypothetical protein M0D55_17670 [Elusimicrobiota bacterium]